MRKKKAGRICAGVLCAAMVLAGMTGCGTESSEDTTQVMGRVTAVSDSEITLSVFKQPEGISGGAVGGQDRPEGTPPAGAGQNAPEGASGGAIGGQDRPEGTPPAGAGQNAPEGASGGAVGGQDRPEGTPPADAGQGNESSSETKKITITDDTKVYTQQGEETTEASISDVELGSMVTVELDGDEAVSITLQTMNGGNGGNGGGMGQQKNSGTTTN